MVFWIESPGIVFGPVVMPSTGGGTVVALGAGSVSAGIVGIVAVIAPTVGVTPIVGTAAAELTPRLPISVDPKGMPVRGMPPGVVRDDGVDDAARLPEPAPHMLDIPEVSIRADVGGIPDDVDMPTAVGMDIGVPAATATPPPSKVFADPNIVDGAMPMVEQTVLPIVPVDDAGIGLTPGEAISVAPSGIPVPPTGALPPPMPSGEVADIEGVGITAACCAKAWLHMSAEAAAIVRKRFIIFSGLFDSCAVWWTG
jgi:hypothetical protein